MPGPEQGRARKRFGQHFLVDTFVIDAIVDLVAPGPGDRVLEIGPGRGALTDVLANTGAALTVVEIDRDLAAALAARFEGRGDVEVVEGDALSFDYGQLAPAGAPWKLVGNLPYNISTPLLLRLLEYATSFLSLVVMVQHEVAERLAASPGSRDYGRLSVMTQRECVVERCLDVGPDAFAPPPRVDSAVLTLRPLGRPRDAQADRWFAELVRRAFTARRKTLANALRGQVAPAQLERCGIDPGARAEAVPVAAWERLAAATAPGAPA